MAAEKKFLDIYDEEFVTNMEIAKNLIEQVRNPKDVSICKKWLLKLRSLKATDATVKKNRNSFFKYFLQILHKAVQGEEDYLTEEEGGKAGNKGESRDFTCRWSSDKRTYVAAKPLPGEGTLVYMAVSKDPSLGWEKQGNVAYV